MEKRVLDSLESCNQWLSTNTAYANGKNFPVSALHATAASSRWTYENLWGIYLAKPQFAWMALWMAVISRASARKRDIQYVTPATSAGDYIGRINLFHPPGVSPNNILQAPAYLYLFDPDSLHSCERIDVSWAAKPAKPAALVCRGFDFACLSRRGRTYDTYVNSSPQPTLVDIDEWQVAVIGMEELVPAIEVVIDAKLVSQLAARVGWSDHETGEDYIVQT